MGKARNDKSALIRLPNRFASEVMKKSKCVISEIMKKSKRVLSEMTKKSKHVTSEVMKKSNRFASELTKKRNHVASERTKKSKCIASASRKSSVLEEAKIVEKSRAIPSLFLTGGRPFCMIKKNTFPAGASRINRQKIGAA